MHSKAIALSCICGAIFYIITMHTISYLNKEEFKNQEIKQEK